jgi:putative ABC transport system permease protein
LFGVVLQGLPLDSFLLRRINVVAGRRIQPGDVRGVMLGKVIAQNLDKRVGDRLEVIEWEPYNVVGIFESFSFLENNIMIIDIREMQRLFGREDQVTGFVVASKCIERQSNDELCRRIKALSPLVDAQPTQEFIDTAVEVRMARSMVWLTSTVAVVVATIGTLNTMVMAVHERTQEIALLRAMGWRKSRVVKMILGESLLIGLGGAALGTLLAIGLMQLLSRQRMVEHLVPAEIAPAVVAQAFAIATIVCVLSGVYPACRAAKLSAAEGLRHE